MTRAMPSWRWLPLALLILLAGLWLHGCHGPDEDHELMTRLW